MSNRTFETLTRLIELAHQEHYNCEGDNWYGCPLSVDGCADVNVPKGKCNCGADVHNAEVDRIAKELLLLVK